MEPEQADSIRSLVAGAVENLSAGPGDAGGCGRAGEPAGASGGECAEGDAEQALEAKLVAMLEPLAGRGNVRATVNVSYDEGSEERTDEVYDPSAGGDADVCSKSEQMAAGRGAGGGGSGDGEQYAGGRCRRVRWRGVAAAAAPGVPPLLQKGCAAGVSAGRARVATEHEEENGTYGVTKHTGAFGAGAGAGAAGDGGGGGE